MNIIRPPAWLEHYSGPSTAHGSMEQAESPAESLSLSTASRPHGHKAFRPFPMLDARVAGP